MLRVFSVTLLLSCCVPWPLLSQHLPPPLLLSFNLTSDWDIAALKQLQLEQQATYFISPQVAMAYPGLIKKLATHNTIGLFYKAPSSATNRFDIRQKLAAARQRLAAVTGQEPVWFRSTPDRWHRQTLELAREAGFKYDSSESERQLMQDILPEFPLIAFSSGIWQPIATWKEGYRKRTITGRPFIVQIGMHTIDAYPQDVHALIDFAKNHGGECLTFDDYLRSLSAGTPRYKGIYLDLNNEDLKPEQIAEDAKQAGITDVFLMAQDAAGRKYYLPSAVSGERAEPVFVTLAKQLRAADIRVHAWIAVNRNEHIAVSSPELAMVDVHGKRSTEWIAPSHPSNVELNLTVLELVVNHDIDGIHLDYFGYPGIDFDFSKQAIRTFEQAFGEQINLSLPRTLFRTTYGKRWNSWRAQQVQSMVLDAALTISNFSEKKLILSGAIDAAAVSDYRQMKASAQDLSLLANDLDLIVIKLDLPSLLGSLWGERLAITTRLLAGNRPILLGCPVSKSLLSNVISWSTQLEKALPKIQGVAYRFANRDVSGSEKGSATIALSKEKVLPDASVGKEKRSPQAEEQTSDEPPAISGPEKGKATIATDQGTNLPDAPVHEKAEPQQAEERTLGSVFSIVRYSLFVVGVVLLFLVAAMRTIRSNSKLEDVSEQDQEKDGNIPPIVLTEFISGFIYATKQVVPAPDVGETGRKMAVILTSGPSFSMFYINSQKQASAHPDSQILVTPSEIPKLSANAYIDTSNLIEGKERYLKIEGLVGLIPDSLKTAIRAQIASSSIPQKKQEQIFQEFK